VGSKEFGSCLIETRHPDAEPLSALLLAYHEWFEAYDRRGISLDECTLRINRLSVVMLRIFGDSLFKTKPYPQRLFGTTHQQMVSILLMEQAPVSARAYDYRAEVVVQ
jgi:hypothetical protein